MSAAASAFAPSRGLYPVTKKPEDKTKDDFVRLVWRELTPDAFKNIGEFEEWFNKTLAPRTIESLGGAQVGGMLLHVTFPHGGMQHFMRWVMMKFTTTTSPEEAAAAAAKAAEWDERTRELRKQKTTKSQEFILPGRSVKKMCPDGVERYVPEERKKAKKRGEKEIAAMLEYGKTKVVIHSSVAEQYAFRASNAMIPYVTRVTQELLEPCHGTTMTIQDLSGFLTTTAFDVLVEQLSGMPFSQRGWRQYLVEKFCRNRKKMTLSEENYEEEFQQNLREIKGRFGNWVIKNFTAPARPARTVAKKSKSPRWDIVEELRKGSAAYEDSVASAVQSVGDTGTGKSYKASHILRLLQGEPAIKPGQVVFENCRPEEALLALWKEADVLGFGWLQQDGNPPTLEECREAVNRGYVDYLKGKPIKTKFRSFPVLEPIGYDYDNGAGKMQRVADMLRANGEGKTEGKTESDAPVTLSAAEPVVVAEVVEVIPLAEAVAVPVSEEGHAPMAPRAE